MKLTYNYDFIIFALPSTKTDWSTHIFEHVTMQMKVPQLELLYNENLALLSYSLIKKNLRTFIVSFLITF